MVKLESVGAVHTQYSYQTAWRRIYAVLSNKFFRGRILLSVAGIEYINRIITGIVCVAVNVCKRNIYSDVVYPFCVWKRKFYTHQVESEKTLNCNNIGNNDKYKLKF